MRYSTNRENGVEWQSDDDALNTGVHAGGKDGRNEEGDNEQETRNLLK